MMDKEIEKTRRGICASYSTLRVADVCDALDALGLGIQPDPETDEHGIIWTRFPSRP